MGGGGAPGVTATCGRRLWAAGARCALPQSPPRVPLTPCTGCRPRGGCLGPQFALLLRGRCAGSAAGCVREARTRLLRSKITVREPGLRCAPIPRLSALPDTTRACVEGTEGLLGLGTQAPGSFLGAADMGARGPGDREAMLENLGPAELGAALRDSWSS